MWRSIGRKPAFSEFKKENARKQGESFLENRAQRREKSRRYEVLRYQRLPLWYIRRQAEIIFG